MTRELERKRERVAAEIVRRCDTVTILTCEEVTDIYAKVSRGEEDDFWERDEEYKQRERV